MSFIETFVNDLLSTDGLLQVGTFYISILLTI